MTKGSALGIQSEPSKEHHDKFFSVDARALLTLGRNSIKDHTTALIELVKNSYDAGATAVDIEFIAKAGSDEHTLIRISDNGCGMTDYQVEHNWLRIGFSEKRNNKKIRSRRKVGEKGIGRISADRLGSLLELRTQANGVDSVGLIVNWTDFEQTGIDLTDIPIRSLEDTSFFIPQVWKESDGKIYKTPSIRSSKTNTGTELLIRSLRQTWSEEEFEDLYLELSILTPPFGAITDFQIRVKSDVKPSLDGIVMSEFFEAAEIDAEFISDGTETIEYQIWDRDNSQKSSKTIKQQIPYNELVHRTRRRIENNGHPQLGPVTVRLMFFLREAQSVQGKKFSLSELRAFLDQNMGIKIYRDEVRVKPYGTPKEPEGDWLKLGERKGRDPAGAARQSFKMAPSQIVGAVFLTRDGNPEIEDSAAREGLIHGPSFNELKALVLGCVQLIETHYHQLHRKKLQDRPKGPEPQRAVRELRTHLLNLASNLQAVRQELPTTPGRKLDKSLDQITVAVQQIETTKKSIEELATQAIVYRGLASLGIAAATFGHETQAAIEGVLISTQTAQTLLRSKTLDIGAITDEIGKAINAAKKMSSWGEFALARVKRDKRRRREQDVSTIIESVIKAMKPHLAGSDVKIKDQLESIKATVFPMDVEAVLLNLLTNAYDFCKEMHTRREIAVSLKRIQFRNQPGMQLTVSDSGKGVSQKFMDRIWEPLFSTKINAQGEQVGIGLGLAIVDSIVQDWGGTRSMDRDPELGGARFIIWIPVRA